MSLTRVFFGSSVFAGACVAATELGLVQLVGEAWALGAVDVSGLARALSWGGQSVVP